MSWSRQWVFFVSGVIIYEYKDPYLQYNAVTMCVIIIQLLSVIDDDNPEEHYDISIHNNGDRANYYQPQRYAYQINS